MLKPIIKLLQTSEGKWKLMKRKSEKLIEKKMTHYVKRNKIPKWQQTSCWKQGKPKDPGAAYLKNVKEHCQPGILYSSEISFWNRDKIRSLKMYDNWRIYQQQTSSRRKRKGRASGRRKCYQTEILTYEREWRALQMISRWLNINTFFLI